MKKILKNLFLKLKPAIGVVLSVVTIPAGLVLLLYRRVGSRRLPITTAVLKRIAVFPIRNHYNEPLFKDLYLRRQQWDSLFGIGHPDHDRNFARG